MNHIFYMESDGCWSSPGTRLAAAIADYPAGAFTFYPLPVDDAEH